MTHPLDLAYHLVLLGMAALAAVTYWRFRRAAVAWTTLIACLLAATALAGHLGQMTFVTVRLLSYAVFFHGPLLLIGLALLAGRHRPWLGSTFAILAAALIGVAVDALLIEPTWLEVTQVTLRSPKVTRRHRLALVADLQTDRLGDHERAAFAAIAAAKPDAVVMAGDYLQVPSAAAPALLRAFNNYLREIKFDAPLGVYAVGGNTDQLGWEQLFAGTNVVTLSHTTCSKLGELTLTGLSVNDSFSTNLEVPGVSEYHVVVGHAPDYALGHVDADLLLAGHTHGGQVQLPGIGPLLTLSQVPRAWASGMTRLSGDRTLFVSRGIGMERGEAPRMRFLCRPQLVIIDILPE